MPFEPRTAEEIRTEMLAQLVAQSALTDVSEGGVAHTILGVTAVQIALDEQRILAVYKAFGFGGSGTDLDDRCSELPGFTGRLGLSAGSGSCMSFTRLSGAAPLTVPAGMRVASEIDSNIEYITTEDFTFDTGVTTYPGSGDNPVRITCLTLGSNGNASINTITVINSTTSADVISCSNSQPVTNGIDRENDESLRKRAFDYLASLCQTTPKAIEYLGRSFQASDGTRALHAFVWEDPNTPAYAELVVDDGDGMLGLERAGADVNSTVPVNGQRKLWFEAPCSNTRDPTITINGQTYSPGEWVIIQERGEVAIDPDSNLFSTAGQAWSVTNYKVWTGYIRELQTIVEGSLQLLSRSPGWRAAGCRVRVVPPILDDQDFTASIVVESGFDFNSVVLDVKAAIVAFLRAIPPGQPLLPLPFYAALDRVPGLENIRFTIPAVDDSIYPESERHKLHTTSDRITLTG